MSEGSNPTGHWKILPTCRDHGPSGEEAVDLVFAGGSVRSAGSDPRIEGTWLEAQGQLALVLHRDNGSVEQWLGVALATVFVGTWQDVVPSKGAKKRCAGTFRMWPATPSSPEAEGEDWIGDAEYEDD